MLDEILGEIDDVVNDMHKAAPEAEINVDVPQEGLPTTSLESLESMVNHR